MEFSTIAAVSTPHGKGGVAILRVSGDLSTEIAEKVFRAKDHKEITAHPPRFQIYGDILSSDGETVLDDGLLTYFKAPSSFTGEDVVEIACHGGEIVTSMILSALLESGAVLAKPGEFSRRAFMNGKLSLTAAEGIADLLDAKTDDAALLSSKAARGKLSAELGQIADEILAVSSSLWAYLDYPEEDLQSLSDEETVSALHRILKRSQRLLDSFRIGRAINSGIPSVILGKPNVGKSTFFNSLLGEEKAIVTNIPGTTRDVIEYPLKIGRVLLNLADTAGVREETSDRVEEIGIQKAISALEDAELIFALFDRSRPFEEDDQNIINIISQNANALVIPVLTKCDLEENLDLSALPFPKDAFLYSSLEEFHDAPLIERVEKAFISDEAALRDGMILTNARQKSDLVRGMDLIRDAIFQVENAQKDVASLTMEAALSAYLEIDGKSAGEKILDEVFSRFCIGK